MGRPKLLLLVVVVVVVVVVVLVVVVSCVCIKGRTALHLASSRGHLSCCKLLLDRQAQLTTDHQGYTPLHHAGLFRRYSKRAVHDSIRAIQHKKLCSPEIGRITAEKGIGGKEPQDNLILLHHRKKIIAKLSPPDAICGLEIAENAFAAPFWRAYSAPSGPSRTGGAA